MRARPCAPLLPGKKQTNGDYPTKRKKRKKEKNNTCADPGIFVRRGPGQPDKKYRSQMANFKEIYIFQGSGGGPTFSKGGGGVQLFPGGGGGSNCLFPIETHITCDFPGGSGPPVPPPLGGSHLYIATLSCINVDG